MRKFLLPVFTLVSACAFAQEPVDALRYSRFTPVGTARSMAIGGALTGLGGDISSVLVNPAGIGMFKTGELVLSPGFNLNNNKAGYLGGNEKENETAFNFGTTGFILTSPRYNPASKWKNFTFAVAATRTANFNNRIQYNGLNNQSSYSEKYLEELISNNVTDPNRAARDYPFGTSLAFNTFLIEPVLDNQGNATSYFSLATPQTGVNQQQTIETRGGITTISFAGAGNLNDKLYFGGSLNWELLRFRRDQVYRESDATTNPSNDFNYFEVRDNLDTRGSGLNLKAGLIFKPVEQLRIGASVHTPTIYDLSDVYSTTVTTDLEGFQGNGVLTQSTRDLIGQSGEFAYQFLNPWRFTAGIAYVLREVQDVTKQKGFLTADVEFVNYGRGKFSDPDDLSGNFFGELNSVVRNQFKNVLNVRLGGELKFNTIMVRGGFGFFANPYSDPEINGRRMNISGGLGWRNKGKFVDFTYVHQLVKDGFYPYRLNDNFFAPVNMGGSVGGLMLTLGFKF